MKNFKRLAFPYFVWMVIFIVIPIILLIIISFLQMRSFDFSAMRFSFDAIVSSFDRIYMKILGQSIFLALLATVLCIIIGYPLAYIVSNLKIANRFSLLLVLITPMFTNMLLRVNTINRLLKPESFLKSFFGISLNISGTQSAVVLVMVLMYLPFMVFPIYTVLEKIDPSLLEASKDLGANNFKTFLKVTFPLSVKGISSGVIMVFLPCATSFTIPSIVSNGRMELIGNVIEGKMGLSNVGTNYSVGSFLSLIILFAVMGALLLISRIDADGETLL